ncbi:MAG: S8 family peptidase [Halioglobus sp.]
MKHIFSFSCLAASLVAMAACGGVPPTAAEKNLEIMLQGDSALEMRKLVIDAGGMVTHDLHIINAVGAQVSAAQLAKILESPLVERYLDDLAVSDQPDPDTDETEKNCDVGGALELEFGATDISWKLYNKQQQPARLSRLSLSWPASLGELTELSLGTQDLKLPTGDATQAKNSLVLEYDDPKSPKISSSAQLRASFDNVDYTLAEAAIAQREFSIEAEFAGDCSTSLIPGYPDNHENTYYPTVIGADALHRHGITGKDVTVAIVDSGLWEHDALLLDTQGQNRVLARYDAIANTPDTEVFDESGHGTHMASVLANSEPTTRDHNPTGSYKGVAPDAKLVAVKAFNDQGQGDLLDLVRAIQYVVDHRETYNIKVLNLSFAARPRWVYWLDPINQAVMQAWANGITVVAAAGNEGPEPMTIGSPGNLPYVITVGAVTDSWTVDTRDDDYIPDFSSRGPTPDAHIKPDIVAPGGHMTGLMRPGATLTQEHPDYFLNTGEFVMTGSSQASALVAGIAALLLQLEPDLSPDDIKCKLMSSADPAINRDGLLAYSPFQQGSGYVSATRSITVGERGCGNTGLNLARDMDGTEHFQGPAIINAEGGTSLPGLDDMLSREIPEKGLSSSRKWGVKSHIERPDYQWNATGDEASSASPFDWKGIYLEEKAAMERLSEEPNDEDNSQE